MPILVGKNFLLQDLARRAQYWYMLADLQFGVPSTDLDLQFSRGYQQNIQMYLAWLLVRVLLLPQRAQPTFPKNYQQVQSFSLVEIYEQSIAWTITNKPVPVKKIQKEKRINLKNRHVKASAFGVCPQI